MFSAGLIDITNPRRWLPPQNMAEHLTREQIRELYHQKMIAALEGRCEIEEVCGLGIETLCCSIIAERNSLLKRYGWITADEKTTRQTLKGSEKTNNP